MREHGFIVVFMVLVSMLVAGCSSGSNANTNANVPSAEGQTIEVQKRIGDEDHYEVVRVVTDSEQVKKGEELLAGLEWEEAKVSMVRPADYRFSFPNPEAKVVLYELWVGPDRETVELVIHAEHKYMKLGEEETAELLEILGVGDME